MDCETVERENIPERYLAGALDRQLKEQWELHYFGCDRCADLLATWQAIDKPLRQSADSIRREIEPPKSTGRWLWAGAAIAAAVVVGLGIELLPPSPARPSARSAIAEKAPDTGKFIELARLDPPSYEPPTLRGSGSKAESQFQTAMQAYLNHDYRQAMVGLQAALTLDPAAAAPRFFLGACDLLTGDAANGARELQRVASGTSPFAQEAQFDLAKAYLQQSDKDRAAATLRPLAGVAGEFRDAARQLLSRLENVQ